MSLNLYGFSTWPVIAQKEFLALIFFFNNHGKDCGVII